MGKALTQKQYAQQSHPYGRHSFIQEVSPVRAHVLYHRVLSISL